MSADDVLGFTPQAGITGEYTAATCLMTLSGSATPASYQAALRSVTYQNANLATSVAPRTVSFQANDGAGVNNLSNIATRTITVQVNSAPVLNAGGTLNYFENNAPLAIDTTVTVTDRQTARTSSAPRCRSPPTAPASRTCCPSRRRTGSRARTRARPAR